MISDDEMHAFECLAQAAERGQLVPVPGTSVGGAELRSYLAAARVAHRDDLESLVAALFTGPRGDG